ncbi:MAG: DUF4240 domain-containing protein [Planctomycetota bacterium]|jgi:hypothetical protein|nr:DUF4240 domain-containing protein [Planctomycetota bacterium]MDP6503196.1 DUF4240 domain-containing protein [Planctomycetota bacterium]
MEVKQFWEIVDRVHDNSGGVMDAKCELLSEELSTLSDDDLRSFSRHFDTANVRAYSWPLWGAAHILNGGCSDDSFSDFRSTLISMGRKTFETALADPNSLKDVEFDENHPCYEGFEYSVNTALEERFGDLPPSEVEHPDEPSGKEWDEDTVESLYPDLKCIDDHNEPPPSPSKPWWKLW